MNQSPILGICAQAIRVSVIKQTCDGFDLDRPGKDSQRLREAGAAQVLLSAPQRWALLTESEVDKSDDRLLPLIRHLDSRKCDLVLVEGFRHAPVPKIEVHRVAKKLSLLAWDDPYVIAVASDISLPVPVPLLDLNDPVAVARYIVAWLKQVVDHSASGVQRLQVSPACTG
jgi:molybdopterin-guanine dinucleotide biosynthesis adapter protein